MIKETRTLRNAFNEWMKIHDTDIDDFEYNEVEWAYECFKAGVEYASRLTKRAADVGLPRVAEKQRREL